IANRLFCSAGLFEVHPEDRGELAAAVRVELFEGLADTSVEVTPLLLEQWTVRGVLDERMAEEVLQLRAERGEPDQALRLERVELDVARHVTASVTTRSSTRTGNCRPMTAAIRRLRFAVSGSWSIRASRRPWSDSGISTPAISPVATQRSSSD